MITILSIVTPAALTLVWVSRAGALSPLDIDLELTDADLVLDLARGFERGKA